MRRMLWAAAAGALLGCGNPPGPGSIEGDAVPVPVVEARGERQHGAAASHERDTGAAAKQILFGDLHVHTSYSYDAFMNALPLMQGEGLHPIADACDFARYCSDLDFWSINDHAETLNPRAWREIKESIRQCNARSGDPRSPDLVAFLGWEWTQMGRTPETHWGHENVVFLDTDEDRVPARPISADSMGLFEGVLDQRGSFLAALKLPFQDWANRQPYFDNIAFMLEMGRASVCPEGVDTRELPADCKEIARDPAELFEKLSQWGFEHMVIPHGTTWGWYTPAGDTFDSQLRPVQQPARQALFEVYSGHGNSEEYRDWTAGIVQPNGEVTCPEPTPDYLPCCWRAGELIRARCEDPRSAECERRVEAARQNFLDLGPGGHLAVSGESVEDWLDCGVCRDCFLPSFNYRPGNSAQYALAISNFEEPREEPLRFRFGFIGSSDNHTARPGTGYKEYQRLAMTEANGPRDQEWIERLYVQGEPLPDSVPRSAIRVTDAESTFFDKERGGSFFMTGGLVAAHAAGRDRRSIWDALERKEVYGTSGPRLLLWFDLLNGPGGAALPMGSEVRMAEAPRFRVQAAGDFKQQPGCPEHSERGLRPERLEYICRGECYHPGHERYRIERIEIVRIRPQIRPGEPVAPLIQDPWRRFECPPEPAGCTLEFSDEEFPGEAREVIYYARAIQEPTPAVNGAGLRCRYDARGVCIEVEPCYADPRTPPDDDCLAPIGERAWASPIYVAPATSGG